MDIRAGHLSDLDLERYREREMAPLEQLVSDDHLSNCRECFARLGDDAGALAVRASSGLLDQQETPETDHPSFEQMSDFVDDRLNQVDRKALSAHLRGCRDCEADFRDLSSAKALVDANRDKIYEPSRRGPAPRALSPVWRRPAYRIPIQIAAGLSALLVLVWAGTLPLRSQIADLRAHVEDLRRANEDLSSKASEAREMEDQLAELRRQNEALQRDYERSAQIVVSLNDGDGRVTIDKQSNVKGLEALAPEYQQAVKAALTRERIEIASEVGTLVGQSGKLMSPDERTRYGLIGPVGEVVQSERPTFRWQSLDGAVSYAVTVFAPHFKIAAASGPIAATEWTVPVSLERGAVYSWQVRAIVQGDEVVMPPPQAAEARFKVLGRDKLGELELMRRAHPRSHLVLGVLYAKLGLLDDSESELRALLTANPGSPTAKKLLRSISARRDSFNPHRAR